MSIPDASPVPPRAVIFTCAGPTLSAGERDFFADADPLGFILFADNCSEPGQIRDLVAALRDCVGRADAPVLVDQEGGRVARLKPPHWREAPPARPFGQLAAHDMDAAILAVRLNALLIAAELYDLGINVDCAPVLDVPAPDAHDIIGDRAFSADPETVARLGQACCEGLLAGGVMPVIKHIPGHGRALVDSHHELPVVAAALDELERTDFLPFRALKAQPFAMVAHVVYSAADTERAATISRAVTDGVIRRDIGFEGLLISDDISMEALAGSPEERARAVLDGGCDVALHCSGKLDEMKAMVGACGPLGADTLGRLDRAMAMVKVPESVDTDAVAGRIDALLATVTSVGG